MNLKWRFRERAANAAVRVARIRARNRTQYIPYTRHDCSLIICQNVIFIGGLICVSHVVIKTRYELLQYVPAYCTLICTMCIKNRQKHLIPLVYIHWDISTYIFQSVIHPSSRWHFCYRDTVLPNMSNYCTVLKFLRLSVRIFCRTLV